MFLMATAQLNAPKGRHQQEVRRNGGGASAQADFGCLAEWF